jgi:hypothetical protein
MFVQLQWIAVCEIISQGNVLFVTGAVVNGVNCKVGNSELFPEVTPCVCCVYLGCLSLLFLTLR